MDDREAWLEARRAGIGGSDAAALFGVHPYSSLTKLWAEKTGRLPPDEDTPLLRWGRRLEPAILDEYSYVTGLELARGHDVVPDRVAEIRPGVSMLRHPDLAEMIGNTDSIALDHEIGHGVVDAKACNPYKFRTWIAKGRPDLNYLVQLTHYMEITGLRWATIAAFTGITEGIYIYEYEYDPEQGARLKELIDTFWRRYVVRDQQPPADDHPATRDAIKGIYPRDNGRVVHLTGPAEEWAAEFDDIAAEINALKADQELVKTKIIATLGESQAGKLGDGSGFTFKAGKRGRSLRRASSKAMRKLTGDTK